MNPEELYAAGRVQEAAELLAPRVAQTRDPLLAMQLYFAQLDLEQWQNAYATLQIVREGPRVPPPLAQLLEDCGRAEYQLALRWFDPTVAGQRQSLRPPPPWQLASAAAHQQHTAGAGRAAVTTALAERDATRPRTRGTIVRRGRSQAFTDLVDADDMTSGSIPVIHQGAVLDLAFCELSALTFLPPQTAFDGRWPVVQFETVFGARGALRTVRLYSGSGRAAEPEVRTGRMTSFDHGGGFARGFGQRDYYVESDGGRAISGIDGIERVTFGG